MGIPGVFDVVVSSARHKSGDERPFVAVDGMELDQSFVLLG